MCDTVGGEISGVEMCCLDELPPSRGGMPIFVIGSDAVLPEPGGREVEGGARRGRICVETEGCGEVIEVIEPGPSGLVLCPDCL